MELQKSTAIQLLGGTLPEAARKLGTTRQAVRNWPPTLSRRVSERVLGVVARKYLPPEILQLLGEDEASSALDHVD